MTTMSAAAYRAKRSEHDIQVEIINYLNEALPASCQAFAVPNGGHRNARTGAMLKAEGKE